MSDVQENKPSRPTTILDVIKDWLPIATVVAGAAWAPVTFLAHEKEQTDGLERQDKAAQAARHFEARRPFLDQQLKLYIEVASVGGFLVTHTPNLPEWKEKTVRFGQLYWSELSMVESKGVESAMVSLAQALVKYEVAGDETTREGAETLRSISRTQCVRTLTIFGNPIERLRRAASRLSKVPEFLPELRATRESLLCRPVLAVNSGVNAFALKRRPKSEGMICATDENKRGIVWKIGLNAMHPNFLSILEILYV
jgi:hypothetical protein